MGHDSLALHTSSPLRALMAGIIVSKGDFVLSDRTAESYTLIFVRQGCLLMQEGDRTFEVNPGQTLLLFPDRFQRGREMGPDRLQYYWVDFEVNETKSRSAKQPVEVPQMVSVSRPDRLTEFYRRYLDDAESGLLSQQVADLLLMLIICEVAESRNWAGDMAGSLGALASRAKAYIRAHFSEQISTSSIAEALSCNPSYLGKSFRRTYGTTAMTFLYRVRLHHARQLLMDSTLSVAEIAEQCGFRDAGYFRRIFRRYEGMSPLAYRKLYSRAYVINAM